MGKGKEFWSEYGPSMLSAGGSLFGALGNIASTVIRNRAQMRETKYRNEMQRQESERAYEVSKPIHQVQQMRDAGLSKAGALNALNGGASYIPAPMESAKLDAPNIDLSHMFDGLMATHENSKQRQLQRDMVSAQIKSQESMHSDALQNAKDIAKMQIEGNKVNVDNTNKTHKEISEAQLKHAEKVLNFEQNKFDFLKEEQKQLIIAQAAELQSRKLLTDKQLEKLTDELIEWNLHQDARTFKALYEAMQYEYDYHATARDYEMWKKACTYTDDDGILHYRSQPQWSGAVTTTMRTFWDSLFAIVGLEKVGDLVAPLLGAASKYVK